MIHPTAIVDPGAEIAEDVEIGPFTIIKEEVIIGSGTQIGSHVTIDPYVTIGNDCKIYPHAYIGAIPQDFKFSGVKTYLKIGRGSTIREYATLHRASVSGDGVTEIGEENYIMAYAHIAHDCKTGRCVILANAATLAGHITIGDHANIGGLTAIHQFVRIGSYAFIGGTSAIGKDIPPYMLAAGDRETAMLHGLNVVGLKRHGFSASTLACLKKAYRIIFRINLTLNEALERARAEVDQVPEVVHLIDFIKSSHRGVTR